MNSLHKTLADLIAINSVNAFYPGGPGEFQLANYVESFFTSRGIESFRQDAISASSTLPVRQNVIARVPGQDSSRRIVFEAHMDTVSVQGMTIPPFSPTVRDGRMYGRGSCDTKAGLAAMMHAVAESAEAGDCPIEVWLAAVVDEEFSFRGVSKLCDNLVADAAIVAEPTENRLVIASKGVLRWRMVSHGRAAHSSKCHLGVNAISHMARVVLALEQDHQELQKITAPLLGAASCNVGKIDGGVQVNFVPDQCAIEIDRRLLPSESPELVLAHYQHILDHLKSQHDDFDVQMEKPLLFDHAWSADPLSHIVRTAQEVLAKQGIGANPCGVPFGSDASKLERAGIPTIMFGPGSIDQAHAAVEFVDLTQVEQAFQFYRNLIADFT